VGDEEVSDVAAVEDASGGGVADVAVGAECFGFGFAGVGVEDVGVASDEYAVAIGDEPVGA
jgi:hypothetical protein